MRRGAANSGLRATGKVEAIAVKNYIDRAITNRLHPSNRSPSAIALASSYFADLIIHLTKIPVNFHPKVRPWVGGVILALSLMPAGYELYQKQDAIAASKQVTEQRTSAIAQSKQDSDLDIQSALDRASRCLVIDERYPLVEGGNAFYDVTGRKGSRLLPKGTQLCSATSGVTAEVGSRGKVTDVIASPPEKIREVLKQRGLIK